MTNDLSFAEQAGLIGPSSRVGESHAAAKRFANLIRTDEREACAALCEDSVEYAGDELARQIRARSNG
jgi:hypothetical protein